MNNLVFPLLAVGLSTIGIVLLWLLRRRPRSMESDLEAFHRELDALGQARRASGGSRRPADDDRDAHTAPRGPAAPPERTAAPGRVPPGRTPPSSGPRPAPRPGQPVDGGGRGDVPQVRGIAPVPDQNGRVRSLRAVGPDEVSPSRGPTEGDDARRRGGSRPGSGARGSSARRR
ncbi:MAG: hypothetical protein S0880_31645 [Actinomycetota bacterium]|nr:hypothetical protein [Actinomycetota bacterium]